jgi:hypothetical protein
MPTGLTSAGSSVKLSLHPLFQLIAAIIWTPQIYSISGFSLWFAVSMVDWTHLYGELDTFDFHTWDLKILQI